jgi:phosphoribosylformylglycinamidine (FGAM) synthase-like enzyme
MSFWEFLGGEIDTIDLSLEKQLEKTVFELCAKKLIQGCVDVAEGGLLGALLEGLFNGNIGVIADIIPQNTQDELKILFGEITGRYLISGKNASDIEKY